MGRLTSTGPGSAGRSPNAPRHRQDQSRTGDQDYTAPLRIVDGSLVIDLGEGLAVDGSNKLTLDLTPLIGLSLEVVRGRLQVRAARGVSTMLQDSITASLAYDGTELQSTMDKLDDLIESLRNADIIDLS